MCIKKKNINKKHAPNRAVKEMLQIKVFTNKNVIFNVNVAYLIIHSFILHIAMRVRNK